MTSTATSAPPLQVLSEAAASAWLLQWSGVVGFVAARAAATLSRERRAAHRDPGRDAPTRQAHLTPTSGSTTHGSTDTAVPGHRTAQEGRAAPACPRRTGAALRCEEAATAGTAASQSRPQGPPWRAAGRDSPTVAPACGARLGGGLACASGVPAALDDVTVRLNATRCSCYLRAQLPPLLLQQVLDTAWRTVSEEVMLGGRESSVPDHQVAEWARRAPVLLGVAACLCATKYPLELTGLTREALRDVLPYVETHFPEERLSSLVLTKRKAPRGSAVCLLEGAMLSRLLHKASLVSLTLSLDLVGGSLLKDISQLSLQELDVCGGGHDEAQVLQELCGLPFSGVDQAVEAVRGGLLGALPLIPLRASLRRLTVSFPGLPSAVYRVFLAVFPGLHHYSPPGGAAPYVTGYARMTGPSGATKPLSLLSLNLGHASRHDILEVARVCPVLRDVSLSIELDCEGALGALNTYGRVSGVQLSYFPPSVSAPPKVKGSVLLPLLDVLGPQLLSVGLTGFNLGSGVVAALARLPELRRLAVTDCWLARPDTTPCQPFPCLDSLALNFVPPLDTLMLLTAGRCLQTLDINVVASEARGNGLTDASVRQLVTSRAISSISSFSSSSAFLTLASLRHLAALPRLRTVGGLARWGLTQEELRCVGHSGPPHILCRP